MQCADCACEEDYLKKKTKNRDENSVCTEIPISEFLIGLSKVTDDFRASPKLQ